MTKEPPAGLTPWAIGEWEAERELMGSDCSGCTLFVPFASSLTLALTTGDLWLCPRCVRRLFSETKVPVDPGARDLAEMILRRTADRMARSRPQPWVIERLLSDIEATAEIPEEAYRRGYKDGALTALCASGSLKGKLQAWWVKVCSWALSSPDNRQLPPRAP